MVNAVADEVLEQWKEIASELGVSVRTAQSYAVRNIDPLPVRIGHRGVWADTGAVRSWARRQDMPYGAHLSIVRLSQR
jgi:hypothetical protein